MTRQGLRSAAIAGAVLLAVSSARAQQVLFEGPAYAVSLDHGALIVAAGPERTLVRWPLGATVVSADPETPLSAIAPSAVPTSTASSASGVPGLSWSWRPRAGPIAEQIETVQFFPQRIEYAVRVRWRERTPRFVRMTYGARLAPGCHDLEGLWQERRAAPSKAVPWVPSPIPGIFMETGSRWFSKLLQLGEARDDLVLSLGGVDDSDVVTWDGKEIGRTPFDAATQSWTKVRRYAVDRALASRKLATLTVEVQNAAGPGGIWRGPCVIGPRRTLAATPGGDGWTRAAAPGRRLVHWCPDATERPLEGRFTVSLTSQDRTTRQVPENVTTGGRFLIPPYVVAVDGLHGFWGLGTLDLPCAEDGLRVEWRDGTLACPFLLRTGEATGQDRWTQGPRLAFLFGASPAEVLRAYRAALPEPPESERPEWWTGPEYCTWGDQNYATKVAGGSELELSDERVRGWVDRLRDARIAAAIVTLDAGWWRLSRDFVRELRARGQHAVLWTQPHWGPLDAPAIREHPEWGVRDGAGRPLLYDEKNLILDFTRPHVRRYVAEAMRSYVSPEGWDADGIKLDFAYVTAPLWAEYADPAWGAGEQYRARVLREVYAAVKAAKRDALVTGACVNPLFGPVQDMCRLNEDWTGDPETYRRRAAIVLALGQWVVSDDWDARGANLRSQAVERPVWGCFTLMSALYRGDERNQPIPLSAEWSSRLASIYELARKAPVKAGQRCRYDPTGGIARRENANGELVAEALRLARSSGPPEVLVVRSGRRLFVTSIAAGSVALNFGRVRAAVAVLHDGTRRDARFTPSEQGCELPVPDAAGPVSHLELELAAE